MNHPLFHILAEKKWKSRFAKYNSFFERVRYAPKIDQPEVSVIVISWRLHELTEENFKTLEKQRSGLPFELIFVANGGAEGEFDSLLPYVDTFVSLNRNTGICTGRNIGATFANAPILVFMEDDGIPDEDFVLSHYYVHRRFDPIVARGVCLPLTPHPSNERMSRAYLGPCFFPSVPYMEGNVSIKAEHFFEVQGWNEDIPYGWEGKELSLRIFRRFPDFGKQIYSPVSILYHDMETDETRAAEKEKKMNATNEMLAQIHPDWNEYDRLWNPFYGATEALRPSAEWLDDQEFREQFDRLYSRVMLRNRKRISNFMDGKVFWFGREQLKQAYAEQGRGRPICIFGIGSLGEKVKSICDELQLSVACFSDNNSSHWGGERLGKPVISPDHLSTHYYVMIASSWRYHISLQLKEKGLEKGRDFIEVL